MKTKILEVLRVSFLCWVVGFWGISSVVFAADQTIDGNLIVTGNVGIGTTNPRGILDVVDTTTTSPIYLVGPGVTWQSMTIPGHLFLVPFGTRNVSYLHAYPQGGTPSGELQIRTAKAGTMVNAVRIDGVGNVGIGTTTPSERLHVAGNIQVDGNINAKYQDVAEWVKTPEPLSAGTVVMIDPEHVNQVIQSDKAYNTLVAGVVSETPGIILGEGSKDKAKIAHTGRIKVKVDTNYGAISVGDLLVTSPVKGHAMKSEPIDIGGTKIHRPGTIVGKALESLKEGQQGEILVLITLQ